MLQLRNTRLYKSLFENLAPGVAIQEEGVALTYIKVDGETKVQIGKPGGRFAGVAMAKNMPPAFYPIVEEGIVGTKASGKLTRTPITGQLLVTVDGVKQDIVSSAPQAGEVKIVGNEYFLDASTVGHKVAFQYMYALTVAEARTIIGDAPYGGLAANSLATIATIKQGEVGTSFFDASQDWSTAEYAKLADNGYFAPADEATGLPGVVVKNSPTAGNPFLVLELNVG